MIPVFLKFHNNGSQTIRSVEYMLNFWQTVFIERDVTIICEDNTVTPTMTTNKIIPKASYDDFKGTWQQKILDLIVHGEKNWMNPALANLTPSLVCDQPYYWIVDADDICFELKNFEELCLLRDKVKSIENFTLKQGLDFATYDLNYTHHIHILKNNPLCINWGHSSFGFTLMKNVDFYDFGTHRLVPEKWGLNHDVLLEIIHHNNRKSTCFHFDKMTIRQYHGEKFQHDLYFNNDVMYGSFFEQEIKGKLAHSTKF